VLVADSDSGDRASLTSVLRGAGFDVTPAASVSEARALLAQQKFELIVLDLLAPGREGLRLANEIREIHGPAPIIIFVSRYVEPPVRVVALELGADDFVASPFDAEELLARIEGCLRHRKLWPKERHAGQL
jgi:DNA-binding response OmpR family regulator